MITRVSNTSIDRRLVLLWNDRYLGALYKLGGLSKEEGFDCFSATLCMLWDLGADLPPFWNPTQRPRYFRGWPLRRADDLDLASYWKDYDLELLPSWFHSVGNPVPVGYRQPGDLMLFKMENGQWMISLYLGMDKCSMVNGYTDKLGPCPLDALLPYLQGVRRCLSK